LIINHKAIAANKEALKYALKSESSRVSQIEAMIKNQSILVSRQESQLLQLLQEILELGLGVGTLVG
jgi:hypothetical protein